LPLTRLWRLGLHTSPYGILTSIQAEPSFLLLAFYLFTFSSFGGTYLAPGAGDHHELQARWFAGVRPHPPGCLPPPSSPCLLTSLPLHSTEGRKHFLMGVAFLAQDLPLFPWVAAVLVPCLPPLRSTFSRSTCLPTLSPGFILPVFSQLLPFTHVPISPTADSVTAPGLLFYSGTGPSEEMTGGVIDQRRVSARLLRPPLFGALWRRAQRRARAGMARSAAPWTPRSSG